jgi:hypothetical protein
MRSIIALVFLTSICFPIRAQQQHIQTPSLDHYNDCQNWAMQHNMVTQEGNKVKYICGGATAQSWWNSLSAAGEQSTGKEVNRFFGPYAGGNMCSHVVEKADGTGEDIYVCGIVNLAPN